MWGALQIHQEISQSDSHPSIFKTVRISIANKLDFNFLLYSFFFLKTTRWFKTQLKLKLIFEPFFSISYELVKNCCCKGLIYDGNPTTLLVIGESIVEAKTNTLP
jgi:hypothetical protein